MRLRASFASSTATNSTPLLNATEASWRSSGESWSDPWTPERNCADLTPQEQDAIAGAYEDAQLGALRKGMLVLALAVLVTLFLTGRLPRDPLVPPDEEAPAAAGAVPDPAGLTG